MTPTERMKAMVEGNQVDRPGICFWKHFPLDDRHVTNFVQKTIEFQLQFQSDFIKLNYNGLYPVEDWGSQIEWPTEATKVGKVTDFSMKSKFDWEHLQVLSVNEGALAREIAVTKQVVKRFRGKVPVIATIFSPLTIAIKMCGEKIFEHMEMVPASLHKGLQTITETTVQFISELVKEGIDGIFFASQLATYDRLSAEAYDVFGKFYDERIFAEVQGKTWFNIVHIHGKQPMFEKLSSYPVQAVNWHDRISTVTLKEAREMTDKILIGGIDEKNVLPNSTEEELQRHLEDAVKQVSDGKLILGPGCVMPLTVKNERFALTRSLVNKLQ